MLAYNASLPGYTANGISDRANGMNIGRSVGIGATAGGLVMGGEAATMLAAAGAASSIPGPGWIVAAVLATIAAIGAGVATYKSLSASSEVEESRNWSLEK